MMEKPKKPMSAYLIWLNSERGKIKAEHPGLKVTEVAKKAGELWSSMDDKTIWQEKAAVAKEKYARDLKSYNANVGGDVAPKKAQKRGGAKAKPVRATRTKVKEEPSDDDDDEHDDSE